MSLWRTLRLVNGRLAEANVLRLWTVGWNNPKDPQVPGLPLETNDTYRITGSGTVTLSGAVTPKRTTVAFVSGGATASGAAEPKYVGVPAVGGTVGTLGGGTDYGVYKPGSGGPTVSSGGASSSGTYTPALGGQAVLSGEAGWSFQAGGGIVYTPDAGGTVYLSGTADHRLVSASGVSFGTFDAERPIKIHPSRLPKKKQAEQTVSDLSLDKAAELLRVSPVYDLPKNVYRINTPGPRLRAFGFAEKKKTDSRPGSGRITPAGGAIISRTMVPLPQRYSVFSGNAAVKYLPAISDFELEEFAAWYLNGEET